MACLRGLEAVILAGGQGTRLRAVVTDRPKVMAPIQGRPFLEYLVEHLAAFGVRRMILALGFHHEAVLEHLTTYRPAGIELVPSVESTPLGTGGALRLAAAQVRSERVLVANGDSFTHADLCQLVRFHQQKQARWSLALSHCDDANRYAVVDTTPDGAVTHFHARPMGSIAGHISVGIYVVERTAIDAWIPAGQFISLESDVLPARCGQRLYGWRGRFPFIDIGTPASYRQATAFLEAAQVR